MPFSGLKLAHFVLIYILPSTSKKQKKSLMSSVKHGFNED